MRYLLLLLLAGNMYAGPLPDAPSYTSTRHVLLSPLRQPIFYATSAFHLSGILKDQSFARSCVAAHTCIEQNPRGLHNSRLLGEWGLMTVGSYGCRIMLNEHKYRYIREIACNVLPVAAGGLDWYNGTRIFYTRKGR